MNTSRSMTYARFGVNLTKVAMILLVVGIGFATLPQASYAQSSECRIAIDPGHGGSDPGAIREGIQEKDIVWSISQKTAEALHSRGYAVVLTRDEGSNPDFAHRVSVARQFGASQLVSVHTNAHGDSSANGTEAWYQGPHLRSRELAQVLVNSVATRAGLSNRGVKVGKSPYSSAMPSALIELAFLSNSYERWVLSNYQNVFVDALVNGIVSFSDTNCDSTFSDVPAGHWAVKWIEKLYDERITDGCGGSGATLRYCPERPVSRAEMAKFLLSTRFGGDYEPPRVYYGYFYDVPENYSTWAVPWIEELYRQGITDGCGNGRYCPNDSVTRAQMAKFLLSLRYGGDYTPPSVSGSAFSDVPRGHWAEDWIEALGSEGITDGCGNGQFCPDRHVTRAEMAKFLLRAKYGGSYNPQ